MCILFSLHDPDDVGNPTNLVNSNFETADGAEFGTGSYSRTFNFEETYLDPTKTYYAYFDATPPTNVKRWTAVYTEAMPTMTLWSS